MNKINSEVAQKELDRFAEALKINPIKRESLEEESERVLTLIEHGALRIEEDGSAILKLYDEVEFGEEPTNEVKFPLRRITVKEMEKYSVGKTDIAKTSHLFAFLISKPGAFISRMSGDDFLNLSQIAAFFLPR